MLQGQPNRRSKANWKERGIALAVVTVLCLVLSACATGPGRIVASPLSTEQQQQAVLDIVPLGTPRPEAEKALQNAGISTSPGSNATISYCALWNRDDGERWEMNVALLFDRSGRLYKVRPANATADYSAAPETMPSESSLPERQPAPATPSGWQPAGATSRAREDRPREAFPGRSASTSR